ncbi:MAG: hypothetical protein JXA42_09220 [Anaerolineales bacterium]|nr:hypothetical protein [Anaerolineales bacterium]
MLKKVLKWGAIASSFAVAICVALLTRSAGRGQCPQCGYLHDLHACKHCGWTACLGCWQQMGQYTCPGCGRSNP